MWLVCRGYRCGDDLVAISTFSSYSHVGILDHKKGEVIEILRIKNRAIVKGINIIKKHEKTTKEKKGGIISKESFIHISNLKNLDKDNKKTIDVGKK